MKRNLLTRIAAWLAAVSMIASPAGVNIAEVAVMAVEDTSVTTAAEETPVSEAMPSETIVPEVPAETEAPAETSVPTDTSVDETTVTTVPEEVSEETTVPETEASESETASEETEATEETSETEETEEETEEEAVEPEISYYVSPNGDSCLPPYEYFVMDYGDEEIPDGGISFVTVPSYYASQSTYSSFDGYNSLSSSLKTVYNSMYSALETIDSSAAYDATLNVENNSYYFGPMQIANKSLDGNDVFKVFVAVRNDNPQFFWVGHGFGISTSGAATYIHFGIDDEASDYADGDYRMSVKNSIMTEVENVLAQAKLYGNEYTQEWYIHNYLCESTTYDLSAPHAHDISGLINDGRAVCESYAKCFQLFMNALDIDVLYVTGTGNGGGHAWNQVGLDNDGVTEWYNVDVTWDDNYNNGYSYNYFNVVDSDGTWYDFTYGPDNTVTNDHTPESTSSDEYLYPVNKCNSTTYSYANHDENYLESGNAVAKIGAKQYATLDAAIGAVKSNGQTVTLISDAEYNGRTMPAYDFTIDGVGHSLTFNSDMVLNSDVTIKDIKGESFNYVLDNEENWNFAGIYTGANTLTIGECTGDYFPACLYGEKTGSLVFDEAEIEYGVIYISEFKNVTIPDNTNVHSRYGAYATNLTLGNNSCLTIDFNEVGCVNYNGTATSAFAITSNNQYAGVSFEGTINAPIVNVYAANIDYDSEWALILSTKNYSVDMFNIVNISGENDVACGVRKYGPNGDGNYLYYPTPSADYTITDGTKTVRRATLEEAIDYIDEAAKSTATYTITYTGSEESVFAEANTFSTAKAKEIIFEGTAVSLDDVTLKTNLTFKDGAYFNGNITTGSYVLKLADNNNYGIFSPITSAANITVDNAGLIFVNVDEMNEMTVKLNNLVLTNYATVNSNTDYLNVTKLTMSNNSFIASNEGGSITIGSVQSTGSNAIKASDVPIKITGAVTLTDGTPINIVATNNIAESGQAALTVTNTAVKATSFTTNAKTESGSNLSIIREGNELKFAAAVFSVDGLGSYALWADALAAINAAGSADKEFTVTILDDVTVANLTLPAATKAKSITFDGDGTLTLTQTTLAIPVDTEFVCMVTATNTNVTVAAGKTLTVNSVHFNNITGTATSVLNKTNYSNLAVNGDIKNFKEVNILSGYIYLFGNMSGVQNIGGGTLRILNSAATLTINNISSSINISMISDANGKLPKLTVNAIADNAKLSVSVDNGAAIASGTTILYAPKDISDKITIENKTAGEQTLEPFYYTATKSIKAEYAGAITLSANGELVGNYPNLEKAFEKITDSTKNYTIEFKEAMTVTNLVLPKTANNITFTGEKLTIGNTTLAIPVNTTFSGEFSAENLAVTVAAGKELHFANYINGVNTVTGTATSKLHTADKFLNAATIRTFAEVTGCFGNVNSMSGIKSFNGTLYVQNKTKASVAIDNFAGFLGIETFDAAVTIQNISSDTTIQYFTETGYNASKVTVNNVTSGNINIKYVNETELADIASGTTILYAPKDITDKIVISNTTETGKTLEPFYYTATKSIKAEYADAVTLKENDVFVGNYPNLEKAFVQITDKTASYTVTINEDITVANLVLPAATKAESIMFNGTGTLTLGNKTLAMPINTSIACKVSAENMSITVAAGKTFTVNENLTVNSITGTATSNLVVIGGKKLTAASISNFNNVSCCTANDAIAVSSKMSGVNYYDGALYVTSANAVVTINNLSMDGKFYLTSENGVLPKVTVNNVPDGMTLTVNVDDSAALASGTTILYAPKDISDKVTIANTTSSGKALTAYYYPKTKEIKAEYAGALTLTYGEGENAVAKNYPNFELLFAEITNLKNNSADYVITVNEDVSASVFTLPTYANSIEFVGNGGKKTISLNNVSAITSNVNLAFENITLESSKPFAFTANKNLSLKGFTSESMTALKGNAKFALDWGTDNNLVVPVSAFGTVTLKENADMITAATANFTKLVMEANSELIVPSASKVTIKDIEAAATSSICYCEGFTPVSITGKADGTITFTSEKKFTDGQLLFTSSTANLTCFTVDEASWPEDDFEYTVSRTGSNVYLRSVKLLLSDGNGETVCKMATWEDVVSSINTTNNKEAYYVIKLLGDYDIGGAMTMPKAGTYAALHITSDDNAALTFVGSAIALTGDTLFTDVALSALKKSGTSYVPVAYNITAGSHPLYLTNVTDGMLTNITSTNNVFLEKTDVAGNVNAKNLLINTSTVSGNVTVTGNSLVGPSVVVNGNLTTDGLNILDSETSQLTLTKGKKFTIGKTGFSSTDILTVKYVGADKNAVEISANEEIAAITGDYYGNIVILGQEEELQVIRSGNKLIAYDINAAAYMLNDGNTMTTYSSLKDIMTEINRINDPNAEYTIVISSDETITGALPLPTAKKYNSITFMCYSDPVTISLTGDITLTGNVYFYDDVTIQKVNAKTGEEVPLNINVGTYGFIAVDYGTIGNINGTNGVVTLHGESNVTGNINVGTLCIGERMTLGKTSSLTASAVQYSNGYVEKAVLEYPYTNASKIKIGEFINQITVRLMDGENTYAYPTDKTFDVMNVTGNYWNNAVVLEGAEGLSVVRSGNKLIAGNTSDMYELWYVSGNEFSTGEYYELYASLKDIMTEINRINDPNAEYTIVISSDETITGALPLPTAKKYNSITFGCGNNPVTFSITGDITLTGNVYFYDDVTIQKVNAKTGEEVPLNINVGTYGFIAVDYGTIGNINGANGVVTLHGESNVTGNINVGTLCIGERMTLGKTSSLTASAVQYSNGYVEKAVLEYPYTNASKIKIGEFINQITVRLMDGENTYAYPTDKTFDVMNVTGNYWKDAVVLEEAEGLSVVRSGNKLIAGNTSDMYELWYVSGNEFSIDEYYELYASLKDIMTEINRINDPNAEYTIVISFDETITGTLPLPTAKKYNSITFMCDSEPVTISLTGDITLTGNVYFFDDFTIRKVNAKTGEEMPLNINVGTYAFSAGAYGIIGNVNGAKGGIARFFNDVNVTGNINVDYLATEDKIILGKTSSLTANYIYSWESSGAPALEYPYTSASKIKIGEFGKQITVRLLDGENTYAYPTDKTFDVMNFTGNYWKDAVVLEGAEGLSVVRSGNKLVAGSAADMYMLCYIDNDYEIAIPCASLKDVMTEINRLNNIDADYAVYVTKSETITGTLPLPAAKKYNSITFMCDSDPVTISLTGDITLTGNIHFYDDLTIRKVNAKTGEEMPLNINIGTYEFTAVNFGTIGNINGANGSVWLYNDVNITGNVNVNILSIGRKMTLGKTAVLTVNSLTKWAVDKPIIEYPYANASKIRIGEIWQDVAINLLDANGNPITLTAADAGKPLMAQYKGDINNISLANTLPDGYVLTKTSAGALTIGKAVVEVNNVQYASLNDAIDSTGYADTLAVLGEIRSLFPAA